MPQLRKDPVTGEWVIIATERSKRPTDFKVALEGAEIPAYVANCPFCIGNELMTPPEVLSFREQNTPPNSAGWWVRAVPNKFPALGIEGELDRAGFGMYDMMNGVGAHEVIIEMPAHNQDFTDVSREQVEEVMWAYRERIVDLRRDKRFKYILIFKNHGRIAGASLDHSHSQLIALPMIPIDVLMEIQGAQRYQDYRDRCIYCDMIRQEQAYGERVVTQNSQFIAFEPFASKFPFETWILPKEHQASFADEDRETMGSFAGILQDCITRINKSLNNPPYNFSIHTSPCNYEKESVFHWHLEIMPRLTIAAGFEMGTGIYINVTAPEDAARFLRAAGEQPEETANNSALSQLPHLG